ncbi:DUF6111 family protein [Chenggangzhangella methanolivorans]|uniref:DUF6111 family protein n=1 Tax=Chenggangzhangella methanolivorans TaxID=1437009 RepID=A0A9E6UPE8_9HYPH|nr:DUF6111 family protein [Chenggangzhangella methanolivorans]QZO01339.1 DUF6111 family protein [Chenggangzhangella methanolivorans]
MSRIAFQLLLALSPFVAYALWLHFTKRGWRAPEHWRGVPLAWLVAAAVAITLGSLALLALTTGGSTRSLYVPAHMENGVFVPGKIIEPDKK